MALVANSIPSVPGGSAHPFDAALAFCSAATLTSSGYLGSPTNVFLGNGRQSGIMVGDLSALDVASGDESYRFFLLGSNDSAFGNGNVEILGVADVAAASAGRLLPTIAGVSPTIPAVGRAGSFIEIPFTNQRLGIIYAWARGYVLIGGTTPTVTLTSWLTLDSKGGGY
jgi:hypothetical protein